MGDKEPKIESIEIDMNWENTMPSLIIILTNGTWEGKKFAKAELMRLAKFVDAQNAKNKA